MIEEVEEDVDEGLSLSTLSRVGHSALCPKKSFLCILDLEGTIALFENLVGGLEGKNNSCAFSEKESGGQGQKMRCVLKRVLENHTWRN